MKKVWSTLIVVFFFVLGILFATAPAHVAVANDATTITAGTTMAAGTSMIAGETLKAALGAITPVEATTTANPGHVTSKVFAMTMNYQKEHDSSMTAEALILAAQTAPSYLAKGYDEARHMMATANRDSGRVELVLLI